MGDNQKWPMEFLGAGLAISSCISLPALGPKDSRLLIFLAFHWFILNQNLDLKSTLDPSSLRDALRNFLPLWLQLACYGPKNMLRRKRRACRIIS